MTTRLLILTLVALLAGCAGDSEPVAVDFDALFAQKYMQPFNAKDMERWAEAFADDAVGMHNGLPPLEGRDAIFGFGDSVRANFDVAEIDAAIDEVRRAGDWAWTRGHYASQFTPKPGLEGLPSGRQTGKFLLIWERQPDGEWLITLDMGNGSGPPPGPDAQ
jgi:uncharacterized protein (TIGR02246 family)